MYSLIQCFLYITCVQSFSSVKSLRNGGGNNNRIIKQTFYENPSNDLQILTVGEASYITKSWVDTLLNTTPNTFGFGDYANYAKYRMDSYSHLFNDINKFEGYLQYHRNENDIYLAWRPVLKNEWTKTETLCVVAVNIDLETRKFNVNSIIESPLWKSSFEVDSARLKRGLEYINEKVKYTEINYEPLLKSSVRYYLSWTLGSLEPREKD